MQRKHTGSKHGMFFIPPMPTLLHSYPTLTRPRGVTSCFQSGSHPPPQPPHHLHPRTHTNTHTFQHHTRFYSWMKSINGSSERVARQWTRRPGRHANPGFPGLHHKKKKKLSDSSGCTIKNETLVCTRKKSMLGNLTIQINGVHSSLQVVTGSCWAGIRWLTLTVTVSYWKGPSAPAPGSSDSLT